MFRKIPETDVHSRVSLCSPIQMIAFKWSTHSGAQLHPSTPPLHPRAMEMHSLECDHSVSHSEIVWTVSCSCSNMTAHQHQERVHKSRDEGVQDRRTWLA